MGWTSILIIFLVAVVVGVYIAWEYGRRESSAGAIKTGSAEKHEKGDIVKDLHKSPRSNSEAHVVRELENITRVKFPTVLPKWLVWEGKRLELDGYNAAYKVALEFSGPLHTKWHPGKENYEAYFDRIVKDVVKRRMCKRRGVYLIVIDASLPRGQIRPYLMSRLKDAGKEVIGSYEYMPKAVVKPDRNLQLEQELGLGTTMDAARRI